MQNESLRNAIVDIDESDDGYEDIFYKVSIDSNQYSEIEEILKNDSPSNVHCSFEYYPSLDSDHSESHFESTELVLRSQVTDREIRIHVNTQQEPFQDVEASCLFTHSSLSLDKSSEVVSKVDNNPQHLSPNAYNLLKENGFGYVGITQYKS